MHADTATRQHWMSVLAHSQPAELAARLKALNITADYEVIRAAETGLVQIQARMGGTGERFFAGDATLTRAASALSKNQGVKPQKFMDTNALWFSTMPSSLPSKLRMVPSAQGLIP